MKTAILTTALFTSLVGDLIDVEIRMGRKEIPTQFCQTRITFEEAITVFLDPLSTTAVDPDHSIDEKRFITFGMSSKGILLKVSHTDRGESIRIINARIATNSEIRLYEEED